MNSADIKEFLTRSFILSIAMLGLSLLATGTVCSQGEQDSDQGPSVLELRPVGYWPMNDGEESNLRDFAAPQNHAKLFNTPWAGMLLDFRSAYQFVEIPASEKYFKHEFTIGIWVYSRRSSYLREGVALIGSWPRQPLPVSLRLIGSDKLSVEIVSNDMKDALGSVEAGIAIAANTWHHIAYSFKDTRGNLYINGKLVHSNDSVPYSPARDAHAILAGYDADWWGVHPAASQSLDGSLCHLTIFDRALTDAEVGFLSTATTPQATPHLRAADEIRIKGRFIRLAALSDEKPEVQRRALLLMHRGEWDGDLEQNAAVLKAYLARALNKAPLRYDAVLVLQKIGAFDILQSAAPRFADSAGNPSAPPAERASAALALGAMGGLKKAHVNRLCASLEADLKSGGAHIPRVNAIVRNALIYALMRIQPDQPAVRELLGRAYARPILEIVNLEQPYLAKVRKLVSDGKHMDALEAVKDQLQRNGVNFLSQNDRHRDSRGDIHDRSYTAMVMYKGVTYKFGEGKSFAGCEPITRDVYEKAVARYADKYPASRKWLNGDISMMRRANLQVITPDGTVKTVYIGGENFLFSACDEKVCSWVVAIDKRGYIHVMGGQHNAPSYSEYMPGTWEEMRLEPDSRSPRYPTKMYWISTRPEDTDEFEFVGLKNNPRDVPVTYLNYMNFVQDRQGDLYLYGRTDGWGIQSWGLFQYDTEKGRWMPIGGLAGGIIKSAKVNTPQWMHYLYKQYRGSIPGDGGPQLLSWAWQPHFYNYIRSTKGIRFDPENRMIVQIGIRGVDRDGCYSHEDLFAYSDDRGKTFHRADGSVVNLPLTTNPAPEYNAVETSDMNDLWIMQWNFLLSHAGLGN